MTDSDDEVTLSAHAVAALQEFLYEQAENERKLIEAKENEDKAKDVTVPENWVFFLIF